ncbi:MAG: hypothetical protein JW969_16695 [Spirochaetales bacterium]|nr:hypothetical protein [Spirochaetales bacterium]
MVSNSQNRFIFFSIIISPILLLIACQPGITIKDEIKQNERYEILVVNSESINMGKVEENPRVTLNVFLPQSYFTTGKTYPVIYYLPEFGEDPGQLYDHYKLSFDDAVQLNDNHEFIVVGVTGSNKLGGSFYANSSAMGNWEDFVVKETVSLIENKYRVIKNKSGRGLFGFSMGGSGALNLGLKHPDVYQAIYALCPVLFDKDGLKNAMPTWTDNYKNAYGAAFAPNLNKPSPFADIPVFDGSEEDTQIILKWENGFGNFRMKLEDYKTLNIPLGTLEIAYAVNDPDTWIPTGCKYTMQLLRQYDIHCGIRGFSQGHTMTKEFIANVVSPFFCKHLTF